MRLKVQLDLGVAGSIRACGGEESVAPFNRLSWQLGRQELIQCMARNLGSIPLVRSVREEDVAIFVGYSHLWGAIASQRHEVVKKITLLDGSKPGFFVQIKHSGWYKLLDSGFLTKLEDREWHAMFMEKCAGCQSSRTTADNGDSWSRRGHVEESDAKEWLMCVRIRPKDENSSR
jgi:hypothetical protein